MIGTFAAVLLFTTLKEAYEDITRHRQDSEINNRRCDVYNHMRNEWMSRSWTDIKLGTLVKVEKD